MSESARYVMTLSLDVLDHLGLNLYSNIPAVLAEAVANCWDADASRVDIRLDPKEGLIEIKDDGCGMTRKDINDRYLMVGYRRRKDQPIATLKYGRHVMGRKGIGKLSLFSIADEVEVHSAKLVGKPIERNAFLMDATEIRRQMESGSGPYHPRPVEPDSSLGIGTRITLRRLRKQIVGGTSTGLRRRLARRFAVIGPISSFSVAVDGTDIGVADRDYFSKIEYLWSIGDVGDLYEHICTTAKERNRLDGIVDSERGFRVEGWVGTFDEQKSIEDENNTISILAWGKLIQEDLLKDVREGGLFSKYLTGELRADFLDSDDLDDIATSDRQRLKEDDPRVEALKMFLKESILKPIGSKWRDLRRDDALGKALENAAVKEWFDSLGGDTKSQAKKLFGRIGSIGIEDEETRREVYRHAVLAFERLRFRDALSTIDQLDEFVDFSALEKAFTQIDELEAAQFHLIARGRLEVIERFAGIADTEKEKIIQQYLFEHLWLLDPSWERVPTSARMEEAVKREFANIDANLSEDEKRGRVDIRYATAAGKHVIIELKKYDAKIKTGELLDQLAKYHSALRKLLEASGAPQPHHIEVIAVVGRRPDNMTPTEQDHSLAAINGRIMTYDQLIGNAQRAYREYLDAKAEISRINQLLERI